MTCDGLSQWGTVSLARQGFVPYEILQYYYGDDIEIVKNAPVRSNTMSYPGYVLSAGSSGMGVQTIQIQLNRISRNYPAIPKIPSASGEYDAATEDTVRVFQQVFDLPQTGAVDKATWYRIAYIYTSVKRLAELDSEGITLDELPLQFEENLTPSMVNEQVRGLQYFLAVIGAYYESVEPLEITGTFDAQTERSVRSFQRVYGLPVTGVVDEATWDDIYRAYAGIAASLPVEDAEWIPLLYPGFVLQEGLTSEYVRVLQQYLTYIHQSIPSIPEVRDTGYFGPVTKSAVTSFQRWAGLTPNGAVGAVTWDGIAGLYSDLRFGYEKRPYQAPGYTIR